MPQQRHLLLCSKRGSLGLDGGEHESHRVEGGTLAQRLTAQCPWGLSLHLLGFQHLFIHSEPVESSPYSEEVEEFPPSTLLFNYSLQQLVQRVTDSIQIVLGNVGLPNRDACPALRECLVPKG